MCRGPMAGGTTGCTWRGCFLGALQTPSGALAASGQDEHWECSVDWVLDLRRGWGPESVPGLRAPGVGKKVGGRGLSEDQRGPWYLSM